MISSVYDMNKCVLYFGALVLAMFASCKDDNIAIYEPITWNFEQYENHDIRPGDDFYRYVCGNGISDENSALWTPLTRWTQQSEDFLNIFYNDKSDNPIPVIKRINELRASVGSPDNTNIFISNLKQRLSSIQQAESMKEIPLMLAEITKAGYQFVFLQSNVEEGRKLGIAAFVTIPLEVKDPDSFFEHEKNLLIQCGLLDEYLEKYALAAEMIKYFNAHIKAQNTNELQSMERANVRAGDGTRQSLLRSAETSISLEKFAEGLDDKRMDISPAEEMSSQFFQQLDQLDDSWTEKMNALIWCYCVYYDISIYANIDSYPMLFLPMMIPSLTVNASHYFCDHYVNKSNIERNKEVFEMLRSTFRTKIEKNEWMSSTAKVGAIAKIDAMECHTGILDWGKYELPVPQAKDIVSGIHEMLSSQTSIFTRMVTGNTCLDDIAAAFMTTPITGYPSYAANCFYTPEVNAIFILPSTSIIVDMNEEFNLMMPIVGHEMCHGFDAKGAYYDEYGNFKDWWTIEDKLRFKELQKKLVNTFNQYVACDQMFCNGELTLDENMADLGGVEIAYEAEMTRLRKIYIGDELREKERRFFKSYAIFMAKYYTDTEKKKMVESDEHSLAEFRVNGILNNIDTWYDAFNVKRGDKFYLAPEQRVHLW